MTARNNMVQDIVRIKELCQIILDKIKAGQLEWSSKELEQIIALDINEMRLIQEDVEDEELVQHTRSVLQAAREAIRNIKNHMQSATARELVENIILLENYDLTRIINFEKFGQEAEKHLILLLENPVITVEEKEIFLSRIRGKVSSNVYKKIEKKLKEKVQTRGEYEKGPTYRERDLNYLKEKIMNFLESAYAKEIPKREKITFYLFGSLVNGFCNNPRKPTFGMPSDMKRVSDVDILIVLSPTLWKVITKAMDRRQIVTLHNTQRTNPVGLDTNPGIQSTGPFAYLFHYLSDINFAGRANRPVHAVFIMDKWFLGLNLRDEPHILITETRT